MKQNTLFKMPERATKFDDRKILEGRTRKQATPVVRSGGNTISGKVSVARMMSEKLLGHLKDKLQLIQEEELFTKYIDKAIENGVIALDTETNGLDRISGEIAGVCLYTPGEKACYVPIGHKSFRTQLLLPNQLSKEFIKNEINRAIDANVKFILHNAKFDMHVMYWMLDVQITPYWDTFIASNLLNENEPHNLKVLWTKYCSNNPESAEIAKFNTLFNNIEFNLIPLEIAYLYAANDAIMTYELYKFQEQYLDLESDICHERGLTKVAELFHNIEMPLIQVVFDMEKTGIRLDIPYAQKLNEKYTKILTEAKAKAEHEIAKVQHLIDELSVHKPQLYRKLSKPVNIGSPTQLAILLYDVMGLTSSDASKPRGTGEEILKAMKHPLCDAILEYRTVAKLMSTYIEALPAQLNKRTGKLHASFNQYGAKTGRFSSSDPNLQNIPSSNKEIRKMFIPDDGYVLVGSDYSQQEPRCLAHMSGDENMITSYLEGKDIYATIASGLYKMPYDECLEFRPDGTVNPEGKKRRSSVKPVLLGIMYGRGSASIAEQMGISKKEAEKIISDFFKGFPKVADFVTNTQENARIHGFVETAWGRKRRLPDMQLDEFEFTPVQTSSSSNFNPLFDDEEDEFDDSYVPDEIYYKYCTLLKKAWGRNQKEKIKKQALEEGYAIKDNGGFIADAERQCVNSVIQGSSADITKSALIKLYNDPMLTKLGYKSLLTVHDEIIGMCPRENMKQVAEEMSRVMINAAAEKISVPMKCDVEVTERWYGEVISVD